MSDKRWYACYTTTKGAHMEVVHPDRLPEDGHYVTYADHCADITNARTERDVAKDKEWSAKLASLQPPPKSDGDSRGGEVEALERAMKYAINFAFGEAAMDDSIAQRFVELPEGTLEKWRDKGINEFLRREAALNQSREEGER